MEKKVLVNARMVEKVNDAEIYETYERTNIVQKLPAELYCYYCKKKTDVAKNGLMKRIKNKCSNHPKSSQEGAKISVTK
ncbi:hypothetical protein EBI_27614 [Enterocytozoon bieneusi H348]|nr:hypothetical protein EBI_27614 [Enterocytozoon bieneusi H348]|eukprot:XP_002651720.1 hypothetical protein EBI_27614 [Enterocytozoon bieneusi H348]